MIAKESLEQIFKLLENIDGFARSSRGCYENANGNDWNCYIATNKIRELLKQSLENKDK